MMVGGLVCGCERLCGLCYGLWVVVTIVVAAVLLVTVVVHWWLAKLTVM